MARCPRPAKGTQMKLPTKKSKVSFPCLVTAVYYWAPKNPMRHEDIKVFVFTHGEPTDERWLQRQVDKGFIHEFLMPNDPCLFNNSAEVGEELFTSFCDYGLREESRCLGYPEDILRNCFIELAVLLAFNVRMPLIIDESFLDECLVSLSTLDDVDANTREAFCKLTRKMFGSKAETRLKELFQENQ